MLDKTGVPSEQLIKSRFPNEQYLHRFKAITECYEAIPCNPCETSCPFDAIIVGTDINTPPKVDFDKCTGCGICVYSCPGLAIINVKLDSDSAIFRIPYEFIPVPKVGMKIEGVNRSGEVICEGEILKVKQLAIQDKTVLITVKVPKEHLYNFVTIRRLT
jgi:Fe-S-cluster-containing hydrogenase component 2